MENQTVVSHLNHKVEGILREIKRHKKPVKNSTGNRIRGMIDPHAGLTVQHFQGQIGPDVTFTAEHRGYIKDADIACVDLAYKGENLGQITTHHELSSEEFPMPIDCFNRQGCQKVKEIHDDLIISVVSPAWEAVDGVMTKAEAITEKVKRYDADLIRHTKIKTVKLKIYHARTETAEAVLDNIYAALTQSKNRVAQVKKLKNLNLPYMKLCDMADSIMNDFYRAAAQPSQTHDRNLE